nr:MAG TPA: hypothetical protein [Caudoviricetes sp.]
MVQFNSRIIYHRFFFFIHHKDNSCTGLLFKRRLNYEQDSVIFIFQSIKIFRIAV